MPVAVPSGSYTLSASVDLSPLFGKITGSRDVVVNVPDPRILEVRLIEITRADPMVRRKALLDLRNFPHDGDRIVPAVMKLLDDPEMSIRAIALSVLGTWPAQAGRHLDRFVSILEKTTGNSDYEGVDAAYLLARIAPQSNAVEKALSNALKAAKGPRKISFKYALKLYQRRTTTK